MRFIFYLITSIFVSLTSYSQNLVPLKFDKDYRNELEKLIVSQIEHEYYWHEKIVEFYEIKPSLGYINLAVKSQAGDMYYFAWLNLIAPQLVSAKNSNRIIEGQRLKKQTEIEKELEIKIASRKKVINNVDSLNLIFKNKLDSTIQDELSTYEAELKNEFPVTINKYAFLDSICFKYRKEIDTSIYFAKKEFKDTLNLFKKNLYEIYKNCFNLAIDTNLSADDIFESEYENLKFLISDIRYNKLSKAIDDIKMIDDQQKKAIQIKFEDVRKELENINNKIHEINFKILTIKIKKKSLINLLVLLKSNFSEMSNDIKIIEDYCTNRREWTMIDEFDYYMGIKGVIIISDSIYLKKKKQLVLYDYIDKFLNEQKK